MTQSKPNLLKRIVKWGSFILFFSFIITCNYLSNNVDTFRCDIVHGNDHLPGWSASRAEAIKRTTYVCDVLLTYQPVDPKSTIKLTQLTGWVESSWRDGFWYLTTTKDTGKDISYRITVNNKGDRRKWIVMNNEENGYGYETLGYDYDSGCQFIGYIDKLPANNILSYLVLKKDTIDEFKPENIQGKMIIHFLSSNS